MMRYVLPLLACLFAARSQPVVGNGQTPCGSAVMQYEVDVRITTGAGASADSHHTFPITVTAGAQSAPAQEVYEPDQGEVTYLVFDKSPFAVEAVTEVRIDATGSNGWYIEKLEVKDKDGRWRMWGIGNMGCKQGHWVGGSTNHVAYLAFSLCHEIDVRITTGGGRNDRSRHNFDVELIKDGSHKVDPSPQVKSPELHDMDLIRVVSPFSVSELTQVKINALGTDGWFVEAVEVQGEDGIWRQWGIKDVKCQHDTWVSAQSGNGAGSVTFESCATPVESIVGQINVRVHTAPGSTAASVHDFPISATSEKAHDFTVPVNVRAPAASSTQYIALDSTFLVNELSTIRIDHGGMDGWEVDGLEVEDEFGAWSYWGIKGMNCKKSSNLGGEPNQPDFLEFSKCNEIQVLIVTGGDAADGSDGDFVVEIVSASTSAEPSQTVVAPKQSGTDFVHAVATFKPSEVTEVRVKDAGTGDAWKVQHVSVADDAGKWQRWGHGAGCAEGGETTSDAAHPTYLAYTNCLGVSGGNQINLRLKVEDSPSSHSFPVTVHTSAGEETTVTVRSPVKAGWEYITIESTFPVSAVSRVHVGKGDKEWELDALEIEDEHMQWSMLGVQDRSCRAGDKLDDSGLTYVPTCHTLEVLVMTGEVKHAGSAHTYDVDLKPVSGSQVSPSPQIVSPTEGRIDHIRTTGTFAAQDLGEVVIHNSGSDGWHVEQVLVKNTKGMWEKWGLADHQCAPGGFVDSNGQHEKLVYTKCTPPPLPGTLYEIEVRVTSGPQSFAGSRHDFPITVYDAKGQVSEVAHTHSPARGEVFYRVLKAPFPPAEVSAVRLQSAGSDGWFVDSVEVRDGNNQWQYFGIEDMSCNKSAWIDTHPTHPDYAEFSKCHDIEVLITTGLVADGASVGGFPIELVSKTGARFPSYFNATQPHLGERHHWKAVGPFGVEDLAEVQVGHNTHWATANWDAWNIERVQVWQDGKWVTWGVPDAACAVTSWIDDDSSQAKNVSFTNCVVSTPSPCTPGPVSDAPTGVPSTTGMPPTQAPQTVSPPVAPPTPQPATPPVVVTDAPCGSAVVQYEVDVRITTGAGASADSHHTFPITVTAGAQSAPAQEVYEPDQGEVTYLVFDKSPFAVEAVTEVRIDATGSNGWYIEKLEVKDKDGRWRMWGIGNMGCKQGHWVGGSTNHVAYLAFSLCHEIDVRITTGGGRNDRSRHNFDVELIKDGSHKVDPSPQVKSPELHDMDLIRVVSPFSVSELTQVKINALGTDGWFVEAVEVQGEDGIWRQWGIKDVKCQHDTWVSAQSGNGAGSVTFESCATPVESIVGQINVRVHTAPGSTAASVHDFPISATSEKAHDFTVPVNVRAPAASSTQYIALDSTFLVNELSTIRIDHGGMDGWEVDGLEVEDEFGAWSYWGIKGMNCKKSSNLGGEPNQPDFLEFSKCNEIQVLIVTGGDAADGSDGDFVVEIVSASTSAEPSQTVVAPKQSGTDFVHAVATFKPSEVTEVRVKDAGTGDAWKVQHVSVADDAGKWQRWGHGAGCAEGGETTSDAAHPTYLAYTNCLGVSGGNQINLRLKVEDSPSSHSFPVTVHTSAGEETTVTVRSPVKAGWEYITIESTFPVSAVSRVHVGKGDKEWELDALEIEDEHMQWSMLGVQDRSCRAGDKLDDSGLTYVPTCHTLEVLVMTGEVKHAGSAHTYDVDLKPVSGSQVSPSPQIVSPTEGRIDHIRTTGTFAAQDLGEVVIHNSGSDGWHVEQVLVKNTKGMWEKWGLADHQCAPGGFVDSNGQHEKLVYTKCTPPPLPGTLYEIEVRVTSGPQSFAGSRHDFPITVYDAKGQVSEVAHTHSPARGEVFYRVLKAPFPPAEVSAVRLQSAGSDGWFVDSVEVRDGNNQWQYFGIEDMSCNKSAWIDTHPTHPDYAEFSKCHDIEVLITTGLVADGASVGGFPIELVSKTGARFPSYFNATQPHLGERHHWKAVGPFGVEDLAEVQVGHNTHWATANWDAWNIERVQVWQDGKWVTWGVPDAACAVTSWIDDDSSQAKNVSFTNCVVSTPSPCTPGPVSDAPTGVPSTTGMPPTQAPQTVSPPVAPPTPQPATPPVVVTDAPCGSAVVQYEVDVRITTGAGASADSHHTFPITVTAGAQSAPAQEVYEPDQGEVTYLVFDKSPFAVEAVTEVRIDATGSNGWYIEKLEVKDKDGRWRMWGIGNMGCKQGHWVGGSTNHVAYLAFSLCHEIDVRITTGGGRNDRSRHNFDVELIKDGSHKVDPSPQVKSPELHDMDLIRVVSPFSVSELTQVKINALGTDGWFVEAVEVQGEDGIWRQWGIKDVKCQHDTWVSAQSGNGAGSVTFESCATPVESIVGQINVRVHTAPGSTAASVHDFPISATSEKAHDFTVPVNVRAPAASSTQYIALDSTFLVNELSTIRIDHGGMDGWEVDGLEVEDEFGAWSYWGIKGMNCKKSSNLGGEPNQPDFLEFSKCNEIQVLIVTGGDAADGSDGDFVVEIVSASTSAEPSQTVVAPKQSGTDFVHAVATFKPSEVTEVRVKDAGTGDAWKVQHVSVADDAGKWQRWGHGAGCAEGGETTSDAAHPTYLAYTNCLGVSGGNQINLRLKVEDSPSSHSFPVTVHTSAGEETTVTVRSPVKAGWEYITIESTFPVSAVSRVHVGKGDKEWELDALEIEDEHMQWSMLGVQDRSCRAGDKLDDSGLTYVPTCHTLEVLVMTGEVKHAGSAHTYDVDLKPVSGSQVSPSPQIVSPTEGRIDHIRTTGTFAAQDLGEVVIHNSGSDGWHVEQVLVKNTKGMWEKWGLADHQCAPGGFVDSNGQHEKLVYTKCTPPPLPGTLYEIEVRVTSGPQSFAGSRHDFPITVYDAKGQVSEVAHTHSPARGEVFYRVLKAPFPPAEVSAVRLQSAGSDGWFVDSVEVRDGNNQWQYFGIEDMSCNKSAWIDTHPTHPDYAEFSKCHDIEVLITTGLVADGASVGGFPIELVSKTGARFPSYFNATQPHLGERHHWKAVGPFGVEDLAEVQVGHNTHWATANWDAWNIERVQVWQDGKWVTWGVPDAACAVTSWIDDDSSQAKNVSFTNCVVSTPSPCTLVPVTAAPDTAAPSLPPTSAPASDAPTTDVPATGLPATESPAGTSIAPATAAPRSVVPPTSAPSTDAPETAIPETVAPVTNSPPGTSVSPASDVPPTAVPATDPPSTDVPAPVVPVTNSPPGTSTTPATGTPVTAVPVTGAPATLSPPGTSIAPGTDAPGTGIPPTAAPATESPVTAVPATVAPATNSSPGTSIAPPAGAPATGAPTTVAPGNSVAPATSAPTTDVPAPVVPATNSPPGTSIAPATGVPSTSAPATAPATDAPTTDVPATVIPATNSPPGTSIAPATNAPATDAPATVVPATNSPPGTSIAPATDAPATGIPSTSAPTTDVPIPVVPATNSPPGTSIAPATDAPATVAPATVAPATNSPPGTSISPATAAPATGVPSTSAPATDAPTTDVPATVIPATNSPPGTSIAPATNAPATDAPATVVPATNSPPGTSIAPATDAPATGIPSTSAPAATSAPTIDVPVPVVPATNSPPGTSIAPATDAPATSAPTTDAPATNSPPGTSIAPATDAPETDAPTAGSTTVAPVMNATSLPSNTGAPSGNTDSPDVKDLTPLPSGNTYSPDVKDLTPLPSGNTYSPDVKDLTPLPSGNTYSPDVKDLTPLPSGNTYSPDVKDLTPLPSGNTYSPDVKDLTPLPSGNTYSPDVKDLTPLPSGNTYSPDVKDLTPLPSGQTYSPDVHDLTPLPSGNTYSPDFNGKDLTPLPSGHTYSPDVNETGNDNETVGLMTPLPSGDTYSPSLFTPLPGGETYVPGWEWLGAGHGLVTPEPEVHDDDDDNWWVWLLVAMGILLCCSALFAAAFLVMKRRRDAGNDRHNSNFGGFDGMDEAGLLQAEMEVKTDEENPTVSLEGTANDTTSVPSSSAAAPVEPVATGTAVPVAPRRGRRKLTSKTDESGTGSASGFTKVEL